MRISVTQEHIDKGSPLDNTYCPVAMAITDILHREVSVLPEYVNLYLGRGQSWFTWRLPSEAVQFILNFDRGVTVSPIEFETEGLSYHED